MLSSIAEALRRVVPFERAALTLYMPEKESFRFVAIEGGSVSDHFQPGLEISPEESSVGWVFYSDSPPAERVASGGLPEGGVSCAETWGSPSKLNRKDL